MATDFFLKIDGIEGESKDSKHKGEIDVMSWSWGASQPSTAAFGGGMGGGKFSAQDFHFTMLINKATPKLIEKCATGEHIPKAVLTVRKAGTDQQEYLKYTFSDLIVSSYQTGASDGGVIPHESCSLNYSKFEIEYKEQDQKGNLLGAVKMGYDIKQNRKV